MTRRSVGAGGGGDAASEAAELLRAHGAPNGALALMDFMDVIEALDEAEGMPRRARGGVISLFEEHKGAEGVLREAEVVGLLTAVYGRREIRQVV